MRNRPTRVSQEWDADAGTHIWTAPPRNQDWIAARIGRG